MSMDEGLVRRIRAELQAEPTIGPALEAIALIIDVHAHQDVKPLADLLRDAANTMTAGQRAQRRTGMWK